MTIEAKEDKQESPFETGFTQDDYLKFAQHHRIRYVKATLEAVGGDEGVATLDPDRQANYLAALRDIEKQVFVQQKLKQDEESNEVRNNAIAALIVNAARSADIAATRAAKGENKVDLDPSKLPVKQLIDGETTIGDRIETYSDYKARTGQSSLDPLSEFGVSVD